MSVRAGDFVIKDRLPKAPEKYDLQNEQQFRRILELTKLEAGSAVGVFDLAAPIMEIYDRSGSGSTTGNALDPTGSIRNASTANPFWGTSTGSGHVWSTHVTTPEVTAHLETVVDVVSLFGIGARLEGRRRLPGAVEVACH